MKSLRKMIIWIFGTMVGLGAVLAGGFFLFSVITEFQPEPVEPVEVAGAPSLKVDSTTLISLITWNIGYGGLGREMDFFYDGGKKVRPGKSYFDQSIAGIGNFIREHDSVDFFLLQEVDRNSKRSYFLDEVDWLKTLLPGFCLAYAQNYKCRYVPAPIMNPMGRVTSGLASCSRFLPDEVKRYGFDRHVPCPGRLFNLKRCFLVSRYSLPDGHQLVLMNIHNSPFDTGGILRTREMEMISQLMLAEYRTGNFVIAGGDWNANPPGFDPEEIITEDLVTQDEFTELSIFIPGWEFIFDRRYPTNRNLSSDYHQGITPVTIIDFFLVSPNIRVMNVQTFQTGFEESDHQPVYLQIALSHSL